MNILNYYFVRRHLNLLKTVYFNFRVFPFKTAIRFPVFVYGRVCFEDLHKGCIKILGDTALHSIHLGGGITRLCLADLPCIVLIFDLQGLLYVGIMFILIMEVLFLFARNLF